MSSECRRFFRGQNRISALVHKTHTFSFAERSHPKRHLLLPFHLNTEHTSLALCKDEGWNTKDMYRWCQQSPCLSLSSPSPLSHSFKSSMGLRRRGSWVFPPSHPLMLPLFFLSPSPPPLFLARQVPGDRLCCSTRGLI